MNRAYSEIYQFVNLSTLCYCMSKKLIPISYSNYYIKWVTTSWTHSTSLHHSYLITHGWTAREVKCKIWLLHPSTICPRSLDSFYIVGYLLECVKTLRGLYYSTYAFSYSTILKFHFHFSSLKAYSFNMLIWEVLLKAFL